MKKILGLALTGGLALSLAACDWGSKKEVPVDNQTTILNGTDGNETGLNETSLNETSLNEGGVTTDPANLGDDVSANAANAGTANAN